MVKLGKQMLYLTEEDVKKCITIKESVELAEKGVVADGKGKVAGNKYYMNVGDFGFIKPFSGYLEGEEQAFVKTFTLFTKNYEKELPATVSHVLLFDAKTGMPVCFMEASWVTGIKTGASTAVTVKYLAKRGSRIVAIFGAGTQGRSHLAALNEIMPIEKAIIYDKYPEKAAEFSKKMSEDLNLKVVPASTKKEAVYGSDVIITVTTGSDILVRNEWLEPGAFVARMGTYQEIDTELILQADKFVVDRWEYVAPRIPEIVQLVKEERLSEADVYASWPEIAAGKKKGRENDQEIIVYTALGIWGEYAAILPHVYQKALEKGIGTMLKASQV